MPIRGIKKSELKELNDLLEASFNHASIDHRFIGLHYQKPIEDDWGRVYEWDPDIDGKRFPELQNKQGLEKGKLVGFFGIYRQPMNYGSSVIINGGGRDVATHPLVRGHGLGLLTAFDAKKFMFENEVDISILFSGANHFYWKNGWRGGVRKPSYRIDGKLLSLISKGELSNILSAFDGNDVQIRPIEESDFESVQRVYEMNYKGQYFMAHRSVDYWKRHFKNHPEHFWNYFVIELKSTRSEKENKIIGYYRMALDNDKNGSGVSLIIKEFGILPILFQAGNENITLILKKMLEYTKEEALNEGDELASLILNLSKNNTLVKHLFNVATVVENLEGMEKNPILIKDVSTIAMGTMFLITDPYSLFNRLKEEIKERIYKAVQLDMIEFDQETNGVNGAKSEFLLKFSSDSLISDIKKDNTAEPEIDLRKGYFPGGVLLRVFKNEYKQDSNAEEEGQIRIEIEVIVSNNEFKKYLSNVKNYAEFRDISSLTLFFAGIEPIEEYTEPEDLEDSAILRGNALDYLKILFSNVTYDQYELDHY
ncbi:MAG: GNAT family N-acetyltransferase [Promethearchaeota archaeon]